MANTKQLALIGDSHCAALLKGARKIRAPLRGGPLAAASLFCSPFFEFKDGVFSFIPERAQQNYELWKENTASTCLLEHKGRLVVSLGLAPAPFYGHRMWARFSPFQPKPPRRMVSSALLCTMIAERQKYVLEFYDFCIRHELIVAAVCAPPPQRRHRAIQIMGLDETLRLAKLYCTPVVALLRENGIPAIGDSPIADALDQGFLAEKYWGDDPSHANSEYGTLVVKEIFDRLDSGNGAKR